jgi:hapalindole biogenesis HpiC1 cyclase-like protein
MKKTLVLSIVAGMFLAGVAMAQPITVGNFSFELPGNIKHVCWDGEKQGSTDVPNWTDGDTTATDSGVETAAENGWVITDGQWCGFLMNTDSSVYNLTDHTISADKEFTLTVSTGTNDTTGVSFKMILYYDDDGGGTRVQAATQTVLIPQSVPASTDIYEYSLSFSANEIPDSIGHKIGIELDNVDGNLSWMSMDNVRLIVREAGSGDNYYVDSTNGNDSWNGYYPSYEGGVNGPWKTIAKVNDYAENPRFSDGDAICLKRGEVWRNDEPIGYDTSTIYWGTINGLTIQDYGTGEKPWIDGSSQAAIYFHGYDTLSNLVIRNIDVSGLGWVGAPETANIYVRNVTNITIDDIYADGHKGTPTEFVVKGPIKIGPNLGDLVIKNCEIFNIMQRGTLYRGPVNQYTITINN